MDRSSFRLLWFGQTLSLVGSQVTLLGLPLTAIVFLHASPAEMGLLAAVEYVPFLLLTLVAGAWIDRVRRRPVMLAANLARAALVGVVPLAAVAGLLSLPLLYGVAFAVGCCAVLFEVALLAYVPALVGRDRLAAANARLYSSGSAAEVVGPGLAGVLVSAVGAPFALAVDAISFLVSAGTLVAIRRPEPVPATATRRALRAEIREGLGAVFGHPILRAFAFEAATFNLFLAVLGPAFLLFMTRELGFGAAVVGAIFALGAVGSLVGAAVARPIAARIGLGATIVGAMVVACSAYLPVAVVGDASAAVVATLALALAVAGAGVAVTVIHVMTIRQTVTPDRLLGRMNASYRMIGYGVTPVGAIVGGLIAETLGLRVAMAVGAIGIACAPLWVLASPVPRIRRIADVAAPITPGTSPAAAASATGPTEAAAAGSTGGSTYPSAAPS